MKLTDDNRPEDLRRVIGRNARRIRLANETRIETVAREAKRCGLPYSHGRVSDFEAGRVEAKLDTLLRFAQVLANVTERPVALADLLEGDPRAGLLQGRPVQPDLHKIYAGPNDLAVFCGWASDQQAATDFGVPVRGVAPYLVAFEESGQAEQRAAKALGIDLPTLIRHCVELWGVSLSTRRDRVAGDDDDTSPQRLGAVTTELINAIRERLP